MDNLNIVSPVDLETSLKVLSNKAKEKPLNEAIKNAYKRLNLTYVDLTQNNNFKGKTIHHTADFLTFKFIVNEAKNWNCYNYTGYHVTYEKANSQILTRFEPYPDIPLKVLIIAKPHWSKGVKEYVQSKGIHIIELGFQVSSENVKLATQIIYRQLVLLFKSLGYTRICNNILYSTLDRSSYYPIIQAISSKIVVFTSKVKEFYHKIRLKNNEDSSENSSSLPINNDSLPNNRLDVEQNQTQPTSNFKCAKCGSTHNETLRSELLCDRCLVCSIIEVAQESDLVILDPFALTPRELKRIDDYSR